MRSPARFALCLLSAGCAADDLEIGVATQEIVGGALTQGYPAVPLLYFEFGDGSGSICSGTLISPRVVLTAAHCLKLPETPTVQLAYFGADYIAGSDPARLDEIPIVNQIYDPAFDFDAPTAGHDIGMVLMERPGPAAFMGYNRSSLQERAGEDVHLVGWGVTSGDGQDYGKKREVMASLQESDAALMRFGSAAATTCQGDSGGPNFMMEDSEEVVAGITSFGTIGCNQSGYGTNVAAYAETFIDPWLLENDPDACSADGSCLAICGDDPDCVSGGDGDEGGDDGEGEGGGGGAGEDDGEGDGSTGAAPSAGDITGGCHAGGPARGSVALLLLLALAALRLGFRPGAGAR